jgi:hypothetical protein
MCGIAQTSNHSLTEPLPLIPFAKRMVAMVSQVLSYYSNLQTRRAAASDIGKDPSFTYVLTFVALGMLAATTALTFGLDFGSF